MGRLSCMQQGMGVHGRCLGKFLATDSARERLLARVLTSVYNQTVPLRENLLTVLALESFGHFVGFLVGEEGGLVGEEARTIVADVNFSRRFLRCVYVTRVSFSVHPRLVEGPRRRFANRTNVWLFVRVENSPVAGQGIRTGMSLTAVLADMRQAGVVTLPVHRPVYDDILGESEPFRTDFTLVLYKRGHTFHIVHVTIVEILHVVKVVSLLSELQLAFGTFQIQFWCGLRIVDPMSFYVTSDFV